MDHLNIWLFVLWKRARDSHVTDQKHLDFLDILLTAKDADGQGLTPQEIQDEVDTFTFEGTIAHNVNAKWTQFNTFSI